MSETRLIQAVQGRMRTSTEGTNRSMLTRTGSRRRLRTFVLTVALIGGMQACFPALSQGDAEVWITKTRRAGQPNTSGTGHRLNQSRLSITTADERLDFLWFPSQDPALAGTPFHVLIFREDDVRAEPKHNPSPGKALGRGWANLSLLNTSLESLCPGYTFVDGGHYVIRFYYPTDAAKLGQAVGPPDTTAANPPTWTVVIGRHGLTPTVHVPGGVTYFVPHGGGDGRAGSFVGAGAAVRFLPGTERKYWKEFLHINGGLYGFGGKVGWALGGGTVVNLLDEGRFLRELQVDVGYAWLAPTEDTFGHLFKADERGLYVSVSGWLFDSLKR